jgi:hypothetical protein
MSDRIRSADVLTVPASVLRGGSTAAHTCDPKVVVPLARDIESTCLGVFG